MNEQQTIWAERLEQHLRLACDAEANGDRGEAEWQFRRAIFYEGKLRSDVAHAKDDVTTVSPVYPPNSTDSTDKTVAQSQENNHEARDPA